MSKPNSFESLLISLSGTATFAGTPINLTLAFPGNGVAVVSLQNICVFLPCSTAPRSIAMATNGAATSSVNSCDDTQIGPLPASAVAIRAVFHLRICAPPFALTKNKASVWPSGIVTAFEEPTPGGLNSGYTVIAPLNGAVRVATTLIFIEPFCTSGTFGSITSILNGASSATAKAACFKVCVQYTP